METCEIISEGLMYVVGKPSIYDILLKQNNCRKAGKDFEPGYPGGQVFLTKQKNNTTVMTKIDQNHLLWPITRK
jgi:hypothetical protein